MSWIGCMVALFLTLGIAYALLCREPQENGDLLPMIPDTKTSKKGIETLGDFRKGSVSLQRGEKTFLLEVVPCVDGSLMLFAKVIYPSGSVMTERLKTYKPETGTFRVVGRSAPPGISMSELLQRDREYPLGRSVQL